MLLPGCIVWHSLGVGFSNRQTICAGHPARFEEDVVQAGSEEETNDHRNFS